MIMVISMKNKIFAAIAALFAISCVNEIPPVIEEVDLSRCFEPTNVTAVIKDGEYVNFNWDKAKTTQAFILELYTNEAMEGEPAFEYEIPRDEVPFLAHLEADETYWFRVRGVAMGKEPSKWYISVKKLETTAIKSSLNPEVTDRASTSISMAWTPDPEVDHIRIVPPIGEDVEYTRFDVTAEMAAAGAAVVDVLNPSTYYVLTLHYKSAERGEVYAWTRPDMTGAVEVADTTALRAALVDGAEKILLLPSEEPYMLKSVKLAGSLALYGQEDAAGNMPVFQGDFQVDPDLVKSLHFENVEIDGMDYKYGHMVTITKAGEMASFSALNCDIHGYSKGLMYDSFGLNIPTVTYDHCLLHDFEGNGGDCFDFRKACNIGSVKFSNSTIYDGMRTFVRIDANPKLESLEISHCTLANLCFFVNGNTNGLLHVRAKNAAGGDPAIILRKNVFVNMHYGDPQANPTRCTLLGTNSADKLPTEVAKNWFYSCDDAFFSHVVSGAETLGLEKCVAGGGVLLGEDPCMDSEASNFTVVSTAVLAAEAGDPRWLQPYVPVPEDLTLPVTVPVKTWNLTDTKYFKKVADKDMVRDGIRFFVKEKPISFTADGFQFTAAPTMEDGVIADGGIAIKVDRPGAVVVSTKSAGDDLAMLGVSVNGKMVAGVPVGAQNEKISFPDLAEGSEHILYICGTAPIVLSGLQWTDDIDPSGETQLATPVVTVNPESITEGSATPVVVAWDAVPKAGYYTVSYAGNHYDVTETSYSINASKLSVDVYQVSVVAMPAATDLVRQPSEPGTAIFTIKEGLKPVSATAQTAWDAAYMKAAVEHFGAGTAIAEDLVYGNLGFVSGGKSLKFGIDNAESENPLYRMQLANTGNLDKGQCLLRFIAGSAGTLKVTVRSTGDAARTVAVAIGSVTDVDVQSAPGKADLPQENSWELAAKAGDNISIYGAAGAINIYSVVWTPTAGPDPEPPSPIDDPDAINEEYNADFANTEKFPAGAFEEAKVIDKVTYCGASGAAIEFDPAGQRIKYKGKSTLGEDGIPTARYASFKITKPGVITHKMVSGSSTATDRKGAVILVTTTTEGKKVTVLWNDFTPTSSAADALTYTVTADQLAGITESAVVYFYAEANINLYNLGFKPE